MTRQKKTEENRIDNRKQEETEKFDTKAMLKDDQIPTAMTPHEVDAALRSIGKDRRWLAKRTGYTYFTLRDCLAPNGKGISDRMETAIRQVLATAVPDAPPPLEEFTDEERSEIERAAKGEGFSSSNQWIVAKVRALLTMMRAGPK